MSNTTVPELCSLITNVCKPTKNFDFPEVEQHFRFFWFKVFPWVYFSWWEDRSYYPLCAVFDNKNMRKYLQKTISKLANSSRNIQRTSKCSNRNTQKKANVIL